MEVRVFVIVILSPLLKVEGLSGLGENHPGLDEEFSDVSVVIPPEVREGSGITWRGGDDEEFGGPFGKVPKYGVLRMPGQSPSATFKHCVAHFVDFGVVRKVGHRFWAFFEIKKYTTHSVKMGSTAYC